MFVSLSAYSYEMKIVAVVNNEAITESDLNDRVRLIAGSSGMAFTPENLKKLAPKVVDTLIEESVKMQEAERLGISVSEQEVEKGFADIASRNKMSSEQFKEVLSRGGIAVSTLKKQIKAQIMWAKVMNQKLFPQISVTDNDVNDRMSRLSESVGNKEFLLSEIFLEIGEKGKSATVEEMANDVVNKIKSGKTSFSSIAKQLSDSASAARGGDIGWVTYNQLSENIADKVSSMKENEISNPIKTERGYYIIGVRGVRSLTEDNLPSEEQLRHEIGLERMERLQQRYFLDLKSASFIEKRL